MAIKCVARLGNEPEWSSDGGGGPPKESRTGGGHRGRRSPGKGEPAGSLRLLIMHLGSQLAPLLLISLSVNLIKRLPLLRRCPTAPFILLSAFLSPSSSSLASRPDRPRPTVINARRDGTLAASPTRAIAPPLSPDRPIRCEMLRILTRGHVTASTLR